MAAESVRNGDCLHALYLTVMRVFMHALMAIRREDQHALYSLPKLSILHGQCESEGKTRRL